MVLGGGAVEGFCFMTEIREAQARYGSGGSPASGARRIIVERCPYCGRAHTHLEVVGSPDSGQRMADCFRGEYKLVFEEEKYNA